jgi:hypothetical protein
MPCDRKLKKGQTVSDRAAELRKRGEQVDRLLAGGRVGVKIGPQGGVTFTGIPEDVRDGMTDACVYRAIMARGSHQAKMAIAKAERLAGRTVDKKVVASGLHSHDGGASWHPKG